MEKFFEALLKVIEEKEGVKITGTVRKKTPEEMEKYPDRWIIFSDELKEKYGENNVFEAYHPSCWQKGANKLKDIKETFDK